MARWFLWKLKSLAACVVFGIAYGAACGAAYGVILLRGEELAGAALVGGAYGAGMGAVSGVTGCLVGGPLGWGLAGVLGGIAPMVAFVSPAWADISLFGPAALIGGALGVMVGFGLRKRRSPLPGVRQLAAVLYDGRPPARAAKPSGSPAEVMPSAAPEGRGDEAAPSGGS